jgi:hypothetical protein
MFYSQIWLKFLVDNHQFSVVFFLVGIFFQNAKSKKKGNIFSKYSVFLAKIASFKNNCLRKSFHHI